MKILIVDDNKRVRSMLRTLLCSEHMQCSEASDGDEAIVAFEEQLPDVVLMDVKMPRINGMDATCRIRERHPDARIVMMTAFDEPLLQERAREAGAETIFLKDDMYILPEYLFEDHPRN